MFGFYMCQVEVKLRWLQLQFQSRESELKVHQKQLKKARQNRNDIMAVNVNRLTQALATPCTQKLTSGLEKHRRLWEFRTYQRSNQKLSSVFSPFCLMKELILLSKPGTIPLTDMADKDCRWKYDTHTSKFSS